MSKLARSQVRDFRGNLESLSRTLAPYAERQQSCQARQRACPLRGLWVARQ